MSKSKKDVPNEYDGMLFRVWEKDLNEIPMLWNALQESLQEFPDESVEEVMEWACYRFDPNCDTIQKDCETLEDKDAKAADIVGFKKGSKEWKDVVEDKPEYVQHIIALFFRLLDNEKYELYESGRIALSQVMSKIREPIKKGLDEDKEHRAYILKGDLHQQSKEMIDRQYAILAEITADDKMATEAVKKEMTRKLVTPEGRSQGI